MQNLITGSEGFIGSHLKSKISDSHGVDLELGTDIRIERLTGGYDVIYHLAAQASIPKSFDNPKESHTHNVIGTLNLLETARRDNARIVFSSSSSVTEIKSPYALQKSICEQYLKLYWETWGVKGIALRYFNVFGERQEIANGGDSLALGRFLKQYKDGEPFTVYGSGDQRRDFVYAGDVAQANILAADYLQEAKEFETIDIGSGENHSILEVLDMIDPKHPKKFLPPRIEPFENRADIRRAKSALGWEPKTKLEEWINKVK